jgi:hypothetical protein
MLTAFLAGVNRMPWRKFLIANAGGGGTSLSIHPERDQIPCRNRNTFKSFDLKSPELLNH